MSISSLKNSLKKTLTALVGTALFMGSLTAVTPASADVTSTMKQPDQSQTLGAAYKVYTDYGDLVSRGDWIYSMQGPGDQYFNGANPSTTPAPAALRRTSVASFPTGTSYQILGMDRNDANRSALSGTVTKAYQPYTFDITPDGNTAFVLDRVAGNSSKMRLLRVDLSGSTGTSADLTADVVGTINDGNYPRTIVAVDDNTVIVGLSTTAYKFTKSGSSYTTGNSTWIAGGSIFDAKVNADGNVLFALSSSQDLVLATYNPANMTLVGSASTVSLGSGQYVYQTGGITIDPANGDVLFVDSNGVRIRRVAKSGNGYATTATFEAIAGADKYAATGFAANATNNYYDVTVTGSTAGIAVGSYVSFSKITGSANSWVNTGYSSGAFVSAVNGQVVTIYSSSAPFSVQNGTFVSADFYVQAQMRSVSALAYNSTQGLLALEAGSQDSSSTSPNYGPRIMSFKTHALPLALSGMNLNGGHKMATVSINGSQFVNDLASYEIRIWSGATLTEAVNAATAHATDGTLVCSSTGQIYQNFNNQCYATGLTPNTYYATSVKLIAIDGTVFWNVPGPNTTMIGSTTVTNAAAGQVLDRAMSAVLPTDPDPAGPASPGFAHQGPTSTTALDLLGSGYAHISSQDGTGGRFVGYYVGNSYAAEIKVVHIKNTGEVDTAFGTSGVMTLGAQSSTASSRSPQLGWYDNGKFVYTDFDQTAAKYYFDFATNAWTVTSDEAKNFCVSNVTGADSAASSAISMTLVPSAATDPIVMVNCNITWRSVGVGQVSITRVPVFAKVTADHTLTAFAKPYDALNSFDTVQNSTDLICIDKWATSNNVISDPNPAANGTLFTVLVQGAALTGSSPYKRCPESWSGSFTSQSIVVKTDGTATVVNNNLPWTQNQTPTVSFTGVTSDHSAFLVAKASYNSATKLYRLNASGAVDSAFGASGSLTFAAPLCTGTLSKPIGFTTDGDGNTYLTGLALPNNSGMGGNSSPGAKGYVFGTLVQRANANTADLGSSFISAPVTFSSTPTVFADNQVSDFGYAYFDTTMDASGNAFVNYYSGSAGIKSIKFDSFSGALASGEDYLLCPPAPFEAVTAAPPFMSMLTGGVVRTGDNTFFTYNFTNTSKDAALFTVGANGNVKGGTFTTVEDTIDNHQSGWMVALGDGKVLVGGGAYTAMDQNSMTMSTKKVRTLEVYDPTAAAGSRWTKLTGAANATDLLPDEIREDGRAVLLSNGKVLLYGGMKGQNQYDGATAGITTGVVITINGTTAEVSAPIEFGNSYTNAIPAGTGKWLLLGNSRGLSFGGPTTANTKLFNETGNAVTAGPALAAARVEPSVVAVAGGKYLIIGDNAQMMGPQQVNTAGTFETFDPAGNGGAGSMTLSASKSRSSNGNQMPAYYQLAGGAALLPSGKVLLFPRTMGMASQAAGLMDPSTGNVTEVDVPATQANGVTLFRVGDKVLIAGGNSMGQVTAWQVYTQPADAQSAITADVRKVLKGTSGNIVFSSTTVLTQGSGATALQVKYQNGTGTVLKAPVTVTGASKLKLDATGRTLTTALPTAAQMNAGAVGTVAAIVLQGSNEIGRVTITYLAAKETPVFQGNTQPDVVNQVPGQVAGFPLGLTSAIGNGTPTLSYKSNTIKVCTVSPTGQVTRVARGACEIAVSQAADLGTNALSKTYKFNFSKSTVVLAFGQGTPAAGNLDLTEDDIQIVVAPTVDGAPAPDLDVTYNIDNDDKCAIDENGVLNTLAVGSCKVSVTYAGDASTNAAVTLERTFNIVVPSQESPGTVGGPIGDAVFEESDDPTDTMLAVSATAPKHLVKNFNLGRGWKILYTPTLKKGTTNVVTGANFLPTMRSAYIGAMTATLSIPASSFPKAPAGWAGNTKVAPTTYVCTLAFGSKTQVAANKKIKTVTQKPAKAGCALPALTAGITVKIKNNWTRLNQKKGQPVLTAQKRTARLILQ